MPRLIDADALPSRALEEKRFVFTMYDRINNEYIVETVYKDLADFINEAPTIDAVPVVRCKDCKNRQDPGKCPFCFTEVIDVDGGRLYKFNDLTHDDGFCNRGERRCDNDTH